MARAIWFYNGGHFELAAADAWRCFFICQRGVRAKLTAKHSLTLIAENIYQIHRRNALRVLADALGYLGDTNWSDYFKANTQTLKSVDDIPIALFYKPALAKSFLRVEYPWLEDLTKSRDMTTIESALRTRRLRLKQSTIRDAHGATIPGCMGVFALTDVKKGAEILRASTVSVPVYPHDTDFGAFALLKDTITRILKSIGNDKSGKKQYDILAHEDWATLSLCYSTPPEAFCFTRYVRDICQLLYAKDKLLDLDFDFWKIYTAMFRLSTNAYNRDIIHEYKDTNKTEVLPHCGVAPLYSFFNHHCEPNAEWDLTTQADAMSVTACRHIKAREEIFISYLDRETMLSSRQKRQYAAKYIIGCDCTCTRCSGEARTGRDPMAAVIAAEKFAAQRSEEQKRKKREDFEAKRKIFEEEDDDGDDDDYRPSQKRRR